MKSHNYSGKFVVFEGLDGSGQSTQAQLLHDFLKDKGLGVTLTKEPTTYGRFGTIARSILQGKIIASPKALQELFVSDRKDHLEGLIIPQLRQGNIVICDRYFLSTCAYGGLDLNIEDLIVMNNDFILPDITFFLDVPPETCMRRIKERGGEFELFEEPKKQKKIMRNYKELIHGFKVYRIDGKPRTEEVYFKIKEIIVSKLKIP